MSASEKSIGEIAVVRASTAPAQPVFNQFLKFISSVRFGVSLLVVLIVLSMIGMLIMQQNVEGFDHYYASLKPAERLVYGALGFFDIYHVWYFNVLILVLALNVILASIERAPKTWKIISNRKFTASKRWLLAQKSSTETQFAADSLATARSRAEAAFRSVGLKPKIVEENGRINFFAERGAWNRMGYLVIHVGFLSILAGGFLTAQFGHDGQMPLAPGDTRSNMLQTQFDLNKFSQKPVSLPFEVTCLDIEQKLIDPKGTIVANNTLDWLTRIRIKDASGEREALVHMNAPVDHAGYRFFQASFISEGKARHATLQLTPAGGGAPQTVKIKRDGETVLPDGTKLKWNDFVADFVLGANGQASTRSGDYNNPVLVLNAQSPGGETKRAFAFAAELPPNAPVAQAVLGYKFKLVNFEKVPAAHVLSINKDPGKTPFYLGGTILIAALLGVFFWSHQRVWALVEEKEPGVYEFTGGGNTNRHHLAFEESLQKINNALQPNQAITAENQD